MTKKYLLIRRPTKAQASLRICEISPEPLLSQICSVEEASDQD